MYIAVVKPGELKTDAKGQVTFLSSAKAGQADLNAATGGLITSVTCGTTSGVTSTCTVSTADVTLGSTTYEAGTVVTVTVGLVFFLQNASAGAYPVTITGITGFKDADGSLAPDVAHSADTKLD